MSGCGGAALVVLLFSSGWFGDIAVWVSDLTCSFAPVPCLYKRGWKVALSFFRISSIASLKRGWHMMCAALHISVMTPLCFWSGLFGLRGQFSSGFPPHVLQCHFARLNIMYVYSALFPHWPVDQQFLQPGVTGASDCDMGLSKNWPVPESQVTLVMCVSLNTKGAIVLQGVFLLFCFYLTTSSHNNCFSLTNELLAHYSSLPRSFCFGILLSLFTAMSCLFITPQVN